MEVQCYRCGSHTGDPTCERCIALGRAKPSAHMKLELAVLKLCKRGTADDLSEAINAFGQVISDLVDKPCRLAVIVGDELETVEALQRENAKLKSTIRLMNMDAGTMQ